MVQQYNVEEKPTVILYTYINRHAEPPDITKHKNNSAIEPHNNNVRNLLVYSTIQCTTLVIILHGSVCVCVCVFSSHLFWASGSLDVPAGVTQEEGHTGFFINLLSAVRAIIFLARRIQPFLSLVDGEVEFCVVVVSHIQRIGCQPEKKYFTPWPIPLVVC